MSIVWNMWMQRFFNTNPATAWRSAIVIQKRYVQAVSKGENNKFSQTSDTKENLKLEDAIPVVKTPSSSTKGETQKFSTESKSGPTAHASKGKPPQHDGEKGK
ncbi:uncharacterized protein LOC131029273 [Cryptomeria japonica]|uniref:uncharacterized protein LOC131029273 n=1 Tax=Cryptomeria japonica TaxID=3369 RepID=UPI0025AC5DED|nr:uncharacterized protein LOC131029273 [Cryptomeria japonica]